VLKLRPPLRPILNGRLTPAKVIVSALLVAVVLVHVVPLQRLAAHAQNQQTSLPAAHKKQGEFVPGEILVRFRPGAIVAKTKGTSKIG